MYAWMNGCKISNTNTKNVVFASSLLTFSNFDSSEFQYQYFFSMFLISTFTKEKLGLKVISISDPCASEIYILEIN